MASSPTASQSQMAVEAGAEFSVRLPSSATSGYLWQPEAFPDGVEPLGDSVEQPDGPLQPGAAATQVFRFRATRKGQFPIRFVLKRPWEQQPVQTHSVSLTVK